LGDAVAESNDDSAVAGRFDDPLVRSMMVGGEGRLEEALARIDRGLRVGLSRMLARRFPGLGAEDVADVWADTLLCVVRAVRGGRFRPDLPLPPWLAGIATARAIDHLRKRAAYDKALAGLLRASSTVTPCPQDVPAPMTKDEILAEVRSPIAALSQRQRLVLEVFVEFFPETARTEGLRRRVSLVTGADESLAAVKRALQEGRSKLRAALRHRPSPPDDDIP
jgi:DNA-directed RNA polymerase specialized sigma24 family protein